MAVTIVQEKDLPMKKLRLVLRQALENKEEFSGEVVLSTDIILYLTYSDQKAVKRRE